jgi:hypothetical protein
MRIGYAIQGWKMIAGAQIPSRRLQYKIKLWWPRGINYSIRLIAYTTLTMTSLLRGSAFITGAASGIYPTLRSGFIALSPN